ncbi:MAG: M48 family metallopeptidase [Prevotellaceae bacterium]|jgi:predicted Zn-dependent protease|nr:M48 family metallopeptidase [Prevotellaceae bacterium]
MRTTLYIVAAFVSALSFVTAQNVETFTFLRSEGELPAPLVEAMQAKDDDAGYIQRLIRNGRLIYGGELNRYIENVADNLLKDSPEIRQRLSFYIVKSPATNAMISKKGIVLINTGLLAQLTNESELAFIIGHEIAHFTESKNNSRKKPVSLSTYLAYHQNSREDELEADRISLERYIQQSIYSITALTNVFDVFRYGHLPFDEIPFDKSEVETDFYHFPENYFLQNVKPIRSRADYVDTLSTHPNLQRRQQKLDQFVEYHKDNGNEFVQAKEDFLKIKKLARFETVNYYLTVHDYGNAISNISVLRKKYENSEFLEVANAAAYYGFHKHKLNGDAEGTFENYRTIEGEKQQVCYFLGKISRKEANVLAVRKLINALNTFPDNAFLNKMASDAIYDLITENNLNLEDFSDFAEGTHPDSVMPSKTDNPAATSDMQQDKYSRIRGKKNEQQPVFPQEKFKTVNYMLVDLKKDSILLSLYETTLARIDDDEALSIARAGKPLLADNEKILVLTPLYTRYDRDNNVRNAPTGSVRLTRNISRSVKQLKINSVIHSEKLQIDNTEEFNRIALLGYWRTEFRATSFARMQLYQQQFLKTEFQDSDFQYINLVRETAVPDSYLPPAKWQILYRAAICPVSAPLDLILFFIPNSEKRIMFYLYDIMEGKIVFGARYEITSICPEAYIHKKLYDYYYKLKKGKQ